MCCREGRWSYATLVDINEPKRWSDYQENLLRSSAGFDKNVDTLRLCVDRTSRQEAIRYIAVLIYRPAPNKRALYCIIFMVSLPQTLGEQQSSSSVDVCTSSCSVWEMRAADINYINAEWAAGLCSIWTDVTPLPSSSPSSLTWANCCG